MRFDQSHGFPVSATKISVSPPLSLIPIMSVIGTNEIFSHV